MDHSINTPAVPTPFPTPHLDTGTPKFEEHLIEIFQTWIKDLSCFEVFWYGLTDRNFELSDLSDSNVSID